MKNINWFKSVIAPNLNEYEIKYKFFDKGDFGSLNQVEFNSTEKGGEIDFWNTGWLGIHLVDYVKGQELLNVFIEPEKKEEQEKALEKLQFLLNYKS